jgi:hypothetical protein
VAFFPRSLALLTIASTATVTATQTGAKSVSTHSGDDQSNAQQAFAAEFNVTVGSGGTSATADASIETSWDKGATWHTVASMTQLSGAGTKKQLVDIDHLGPDVRAIIKPGGSPAGPTHGSVRLLTTALLEAR